VRVVYQRSPRRDETWRYSLAGLEDSLDRIGMAAVGHDPSPASSFVARGLGKLRLLRQIAQVHDEAVFVALMGPMESWLFPRCFFGQSTVYCFDCWPRDYARWASLFRRHRIELAFFSARRSAEVFASRLPEMHSVWLPEATDPHAYDPSKPLAQRTIDVLELGRRHESLHAKVVGPLADGGETHRYELAAGEIVFSSRDALVAGLGDAKLSILFPSSLTHPSRSGDVETVTHKYFESIASGCIPVGRCPTELEDLFGYDPVVRLDELDPVAHIRALLDDLDTYRGLVERNLARLLEVGTWDARARTLVEVLQARGYALE
jgi:Glycosyl transferases group 1